MAKMSYKRGAKAEWNHLSEGYKPRKLRDSDILFRELFDRHLPVSSDLRCIEIGAVPGTFLWYFNTKFKYQITGLDFSDKDHYFHANMALNGIQDYEFIKMDFLEWQPTKAYDVVASFGFVEHFNNYEEVIVKHCELVAPNGYLIITMPNFRYMQWLYHWMFDRANLRIHNTDVMNLATLDRIMAAQGLEQVFSGYLGGLTLWRESKLRGLPSWIDGKIRGVARRYGTGLPPNRLYSGYLGMLYQRPS